MKGIVFDIQHYCIHDGPGIRVNVFLKGCPLRCLWCQNPESQKIVPQIMYNAEKCTGCGKCVDACPVDALSLEVPAGASKPVIITDRSKCTACGSCVKNCYAEARSLAGEYMEIEDVFKKIEQDKLFFGNDGGITVTGGEPLVQWEFVAALLKMCKENSINTCIETCGYADWEKVKAVIEHVDLVLYDVKHMDSEQHKICTGVGNEKILENIRKISQELGKDVIIRVPVIPGYNDTVENMDAMGRFIKEELPTCLEVNLLPFHNMGESKLIQLEELSDFSSRTPDEEEMALLRATVAAYSITVK